MIEILRVLWPAIAIAVMAASAPTAHAQAGATGGAAGTPPASDSASATTAPAGPWAVEGPAGDRWVTKWNPRVDLFVTAGQAPVGNLRVAGARFHDEETGAVLGESGLRLCRAGRADSARVEGPCAAPATIAAGGAGTVALDIAREHLPAGVYRGTVWIEADGGAPRRVPLSFRIEHTSDRRWFLGGAAITLGVLLAWLLTGYLRQLRARRAVLLQTAAMREVLRDLARRAEDAAKQADVALNTIQNLISFLMEKLSGPALDLHGLPPRLPDPYGGGTDGTAALSAHLDELGRRVSALAVIVRIGVGEAAAELKAGAAVGKVRQALDELDTAASNHADPASATDAVNRILAPLRAHTAMESAVAASRAATTVREVRMQVERVSLAAWLIWMALTVLVGLVALVLPDYGFGTPLDYCRCVLWGVGLPIAGQELQQLTPGTTATTLKLTMPA